MKQITKLIITLIFLFSFGSTVEASVLYTSTKENHTFRVGDIKPQYFPVYFGAAGRWNIEVYKDKKEDVEVYYSKAQESLKRISNNLKCFPIYINSDLVYPKIYISPIKLQKEGRPGITGAWYDGPFNNIVITTDTINNFDQDTITYTMAHELGHWVWAQIISDEERQQYKKIAGSITKEDLSLMDKYQLDKERVIQEWFADDFAQYACLLQIDPTKEGYSPLGGSHGKPDYLYNYFKRYHLTRLTGVSTAIDGAERE